MAVNIRPRLCMTTSQTPEWLCTKCRPVAWFDLGYASKKCKVCGHSLHHMCKYCGIFFSYGRAWVSHTQRCKLKTSQQNKTRKRGRIQHKEKRRKRKKRKRRHERRKKRNRRWRKKRRKHTNDNRSTHRRQTVSCILFLFYLNFLV